MRSEQYDGTCRGGDRIEARVTQDVPAALGAVFDFVCCPLNDALWIDAIAGTRQVNGVPIGVGARFEQVAVAPLMRVKVIWEIVDFQRNRRMVGASLPGNYEFVGGYDFSPISSGTAVTKFAAFGHLGVLRLLPAKVAENLMAERFERWLRHLATLAQGWR